MKTHTPAGGLRGLRWPALTAALTAGVIGLGGVVAADTGQGTSTVPGASAPKTPAGRWAATPVPVEKGDLTAVAALGRDKVWAVGYRLIGNSGGEPVALRWDGSAWKEESKLPTGTWPQALSVGSESDIWAAGSGTAHWDGTTWTRHAPAADAGGGRVAPDALARSSDGTVWAVGRAVPMSVKNGVPSIQSWNGTAWQAHTLPEVGKGELTALTVVAPDDIWAVGSSFATGATPQRALVLHWDGETWKQVDAPAGPAGEHRWFGAVTATKSGAVWAVGGRLSADGVERPFTARWNGERFTAVAAPKVADGRLRAVSQSTDGTVWAAGGKGAVSVLLRWDAGDRRWERGADPALQVRGFTTVPGSRALWTVGIAKEGDMVPSVARLTP
ncbi:hypothetical protein [Streptomyces jumonjinensis]|uniref:hypothetical protein n=1 Tax=Streptomyces jumonjinensis TaxID=1945 RepID=UPI0037A7E047